MTRCPSIPHYQLYFLLRYRTAKTSGAVITGGQVGRWTGGQVDRWPGGQVGKWTGGQVGRWTGEAGERVALLFQTSRRGVSTRALAPKKGENLFS